MRRLTAIGAVLGACLLAVVLIGAKPTTPKGLKFKILFSNSFGLAEGGDLKIAGVRAGKITGLDIDRKTHRALVKFEIKKTGFGSLRSHCPMNIEASLPEAGAIVWRDNPGVRNDVPIRLHEH